MTKSLEETISGIHTLQITMPRHQKNPEVYALLRKNYAKHLYFLAVHESWPAHNAAVSWYASHISERRES